MIYVVHKLNMFYWESNVSEYASTKKEEVERYMNDRHKNQSKYWAEKPLKVVYVNSADVDSEIIQKNRIGCDYFVIVYGNE